MLSQAPWEASSLTLTELPASQSSYPDTLPTHMTSSGSFGGSWHQHPALLLAHLDKTIQKLLLSYTCPTGMGIMAKAAMGDGGGAAMVFWEVTLWALQVG